MKTTLDLLDMAMRTARSSNALATELKLSRNALTNARNRGRLSPILAGTLADRIGQPVAEWMALAAIEAEPEIAAGPEVRRLADKVRKSYFDAFKRAAAAARRAHRRGTSNRAALRTA